MTDSRRLKIIRYCDYICLFSLYGIAFFLPISKAIIESLSILAIISFLIKKISSSEGATKTPINLGIYLYLIISVLSFFTSTNLRISITAFFAKTLQNVVFFFVVAETLSKKNRIGNLLCFLFLSATVLGIDGVYQHFTSKDFIRNRPDLFDGYRLRIYASFGTPNAFGCYLMMVIPFVIAIFFYKTSIKIIKISCALLFLLLVICLILTVSRGAWLAFLASLLFMSMWLKSLLIFLMIIAIASIAIQPFCQPMLRNRLANFLNLFSEADTDRKMMWRIAWNMFGSSPWLGVGLGTFMFNFKKFAAEDFSYGISYAHNCHLQMASEIGIIGWLAFLSILFLFFYKGIKTLNTKPKIFSWYILLSAQAAIFGYSVQMGVDTILYSLDLGMLFWLVLGLGVSALKNLEFQKNNS